MEERLGQQNLHCPVCRARVDPAFLVCPVCTTKLKQACARCKAPLEPLWQVCPYCETPIDTPRGARARPAAWEAAGRAERRPQAVAPLMGVGTDTRARQARRCEAQARGRDPRPVRARAASTFEPPGSLTVDRELAEEHYAEHVEKPFFGELVEFITSGADAGARAGGRRRDLGRPHDDGRDEPGRRRAGHDSRRPGARDAGQPRARLRLARVGRARGRAVVPRCRARLRTRRNREHWDARATSTRRGTRAFIGQQRAALGRVAARRGELRVLGDVAGKDVLELGCGAAQWSILLAGRGARPVGLDNSARQLEHARRAMATPESSSRSSTRARRTCRSTTRASTSSSATTARSTFGDPFRVVPEAARAAPAGRPVRVLALDVRSLRSAGDPEDGSHATRRSTRLLRPAPLRRRRRTSRSSSSSRYGEWIRLFRANGLGSRSSSRCSRPRARRRPTGTRPRRAWARRWPMEEIWKVRKR